jgi:voltage-dependent calcium channel R type alpha-1E
MLACKAGVECQPPANARHGGKGTNKCGSDLAYLYFCSFVFLSSFLVSLNLYLNVISSERILDVEFIRGGYYG